MKDEFLEDENCILIIPPRGKSVKIAFEDDCKIGLPDTPMKMEYTITKNKTLEEMASELEMSVEYLVGLMKRSM